MIQFVHALYILSMPVLVDVSFSPRLEEAGRLQNHFIFLIIEIAVYKYLFKKGKSCTHLKAYYML